MSTPLARRPPGAACPAPTLCSPCPSPDAPRPTRPTPLPLAPRPAPRRPHPTPRTQRSSPASSPLTHRNLAIFVPPSPPPPPPFPALTAGERALDDSVTLLATGVKSASSCQSECVSQLGDDPTTGCTSYTYVGWCVCGVGGGGL